MTKPTVGMLNAHGQLSAMSATFAVSSATTQFTGMMEKWGTKETVSEYLPWVIVSWEKGTKCGMALGSTG